MASFSIAWRSSTRKDLRKIPAQDVLRILESVEALASNPLPHGCQKLSGSDNTYRIRVGDYRVIYEARLESHAIEVVRVRHRKDVYRP